MRNIPKNDPPEVLVGNKEAWDRALEQEASDTNRYRYRDPQIKQALMAETYGKCVYCESKVGHNCPGDTEHKSPQSVRPDLVFEWQNMTIACNECNRRKGSYYDPSCMFLDPNTDDVEGWLVHAGPVVFNTPGKRRAELTVRMLKIDRTDSRKELIGRKMEALENVRHLVERIAAETNPVLKGFLLAQLKECCGLEGEFSGMVKTHVDGLPEGWENQ